MQDETTVDRAAGQEADTVEAVVETDDAIAESADMVVETDKAAEGSSSEAEATDAEESESREKTSGELLKTILWALVIALVIRISLFQPFSIPSGSMKPTLLVGDYLFVSKYSYGYSRYSMPWGPRIFDGRIWSAPVTRGDVAVFKYPADNRTDYIKRIIGLPGDRIQVTNGHLIINGTPVQREFVSIDIDVRFNGNGRRDNVKTKAFRETLPNGVTYLTFDQTSHGGADNTRVFIVPPRHYFAMGDNRDNSQDSRAPNVGFVPEENLVGKAQLIFFSLGENARFWQLWKWPISLRYDRFMQGVD